MTSEISSETKPVYTLPHVVRAQKSVWIMFSIIFLVVFIGPYLVLAIQNPGSNLWQPFLLFAFVYSIFLVWLTYFRIILTTDRIFLRTSLRGEKVIPYLNIDGVEKTIEYGGRYASETPILNIYIKNESTPIKINSKIMSQKDLGIVIDAILAGNPSAKYPFSKDEPEIIEDKSSKNWGNIASIFAVIAIIFLIILRTVFHVNIFTENVERDLIVTRNLWAEHRYEEMVKPATDALNHAVTNKMRARAYYWLGVSYAARHIPDQGEENAKKSIELDPNFSGPYMTLSSVYGDRGDYQTALEYAKKAVDLDPNYAWTHNTLGVSYGDLGNKMEAIKEFNEAIRLDSSVQVFKSNLEWVRSL